MKTYIYILQDPVTLSIRYVGKSINPRRRFNHHMSNKDKVKSYCSSWIKSLRKKKLKPIFTIIDEIEGDWIWLEKYWISQIKAWGFKLTNHTEGGDGSSGVSAHWNNESVSLYDKDGCFIKFFSSQKECASYLNIPRENVSASVAGRNILLLKKYQVKPGASKKSIGKATAYKDYEWKNKPKIHWLSKSIKCIEDDKIFSSTTEAADYYKVLTTTINNILNGRSKKTRTGKSFCRI